MNFIRENSIGMAWLKAIEMVIKNGYNAIYDGDQLILEKIPVIIEITNPKSTDEILEKYSSNDILTLMHENFRRMSPIKDWGYSYGQRLFDFNGENQIENIVKLLHKNINAKSATLSLLHPPFDLIHKPCLVSLDFKVRGSKLIVSGFFRSQDIGKKMYADAVELLNLGHLVGSQIGIKDITIIHLISSAHIYTADLDSVFKILKNEGVLFTSQ